MTLSDRRLLIELGAVLIIKLFILFLIKSFFFNTKKEEAHPPLQQHFFSQPATDQNERHTQQTETVADKER